MSFIMPSQRGFEHVAQPDLAELSMQQTSRMQIPVASLDGYPAAPTGPNHPGVQNGVQQSFVSDHSHNHLPRIGETRCYWALLSSDLHFIYLDPVLASHLEEQAGVLVGKSILSFVHPDEQGSAKHDLGSVLENRTLHGSVTRVRFSRLSRVRRLLGYQGPGVPWTDAEKIALDSNYMAVDIAINWAAEGLVLCFIHAAVDLTPSDNDESRKTGWTNWCGTPELGLEQLQVLYQRLLVCVPQTGAMSRMFQILSNEGDKPLMLSWPPDQGQGQTPSARDFAKLVNTANLSGSAPNVNDAKTSCTRRHKSLQDMPGAGKVESCFIPHGSVIFACHKLSTPSRDHAATGMQQLGYSGNNYASTSQPPPSYYDHGSSAYPMNSMQSSAASYSNYLPQSAHQVPSQSHYSPQHWSQGAEPSTSQYNQWSSHSPAPSISPLPSSVTLRSSPYSQQEHEPSQSWPSQSPHYMDPNFQRSLTPNYGYGAGGGSDGASTSTVSDAVPSARRRVSPASARESYGSRNGNRPTGVLRCSSCKATHSPEWRKGPSGKKELCNACGLRYARSRAKKEGTNSTSQRRRKDKGMATGLKQESPLPSSPVSVAYSGLRRSLHDDSSFISNSSSGSDAYPYSGPHGLEGLTPSPSPPASSVNFVHYSHPHPQHHHSQNHPSDSRHQFSSSTSSFYSVPSPLSNPPVQDTQHTRHGNHSPQQSASRPDHIPPYPGRISPMMSSASPVSSSPLSTMTPASFERERDRDRGLPPTPVSADSRYGSNR